MSTTTTYTSGISIPPFPSAWFMNGSAVLGTNYSYIPIYDNIPNYETLGILSCDTAYYVMPRFKLTVYNEINYGGTSYIIDNTNGQFPMFYTILSPYISTGKSCQVSFVGTITVTNSTT